MGNRQSMPGQTPRELLLDSVSLKYAEAKIERPRVGVDAFIRCIAVTRRADAMHVDRTRILEATSLRALNGDLRSSRVLHLHQTLQIPDCSAWSLAFEFGRYESGVRYPCRDPLGSQSGSLRSFRCLVERSRLAVWGVRRKEIIRSANQPW